METDNRIIETMRNRRIEPLLVFSNGYPNIQCSKEAVSYRFNDLLSYCRIGLSTYRIGKPYIQLFIPVNIQCVVSLRKQIKEPMSVHRYI